MPAPAPSGERGDEAWLALSQAMDHGMIDRNGKRAGRVDDLLLEVVEDEHGDRRLVLDSIVSGPLPRPVPAWFRMFARACYRMCGIRDPHPTIVSWQHVEAVDALVHIDVDRDEAGLQPVDRSVLRFVSEIPGSAGRGHHG